MHPSVRYLLKAQIYLVAFLLICLVLKHDAMLATDGISYFGVHETTVIPYGIAFLACALNIIKGAAQLPRDDGNKIIKRGLEAIAILLLGLLITPYTAGSYINLLHITSGTLLFISELGLAGWLVLNSKQSGGRLKQLLLMQFTAGVVALLSLSFIGLDNTMLAGQVVFQIVFGMILISELSFKLNEHERNDAHKHIRTKKQPSTLP